MEREMVMYGGKVFGEEVSKYGLDHGYLDYRTLAKIVGPTILNNDLISHCTDGEWEIITESEERDIYQYYIISEDGFRFLGDFTDEIVFYNAELELFLWGITHYGTAWDHVLTNIKLKEVEHNHA